MADTAIHTNGDRRRAATLTVHYGRSDTVGVNAVLDDAIEADRVTELFMAVLELHEAAVPQLLTADGGACLTQMLGTLAGDPNANPDCRRAARLILAHGARDLDALNDVLHEAAVNLRGAQLMIGLFAVYSAFVPQLYCELGLSVVERSALHWAAAEELQ